MTESSFVCLYCGCEKPEIEESLEHAIPQFMGGDVAPQQYMLRNVCKKCNNDLGMFVDASYAKSWFVTNGLSIAARRLYTGLADPPLPLVCMGLSKIDGLILSKEQVAEHWVGPSGETIVWLRADDKRIHGYTGGNPSDKRNKSSTAYLCMTSQDLTRWRMGVASFRRMFRHRKVRKVLCTDLVGPNGCVLLPGFDVRTADDEINAKTIMAVTKSGSITGQLAIQMNFDHRFIAKMVLGVGYSLFGEPYIGTEIAKEARAVCWPKHGVSGQMRGSPTFEMPRDSYFSKISGYPNAVVLAIVDTGDFYALSVTVDQAIPFTVALAYSALISPFFNREEGYALVLFLSIGKAIEMTLMELFAHSSGVRVHPELALIDERTRRAAVFRSQLSPV